MLGLAALRPQLDPLIALARAHVTEHPFHVGLEFFLVLLITYILFVKRAYDPAKRGYGRRGLPPLSDKEAEELIVEWQPEALVPETDDLLGAEGSADDVTPYLLSSFVPTPEAPMRVLIEGDAAPKTWWACADHLGLGASKPVKAAARATLEKYTVGSCGPRGFYGTTELHLELEASIARFMGSDESITYSDDTATIVSVIPAFSKRGDVLLIDSAANYGIQQGARLSRSKVVWWSHNDMGDLERHLRAVRESDLGKHKGAALEQRRFIVVEGLYASTGDLCPLPEVMRLAQEYKWRVILDDRLGFGVLGAAGRGTAEHFKIPAADVHVTVGSLSTTLGAVGGFCFGSREVVDHQRLSGSGYCFSASAPPFLCTTATAALEELAKSPDAVARLHARCASLHARLDAACRPGGTCDGLALVSHEASPIKHLVLVNAAAGELLSKATLHSPVDARMLSPTTQRLATPDGDALRARGRDDAVLAQIVKLAAAGGVLLARSHTLPSEPFRARPTLKLCVTLRHTDADVDELLRVLAAAVQGTL